MEGALMQNSIFFSNIFGRMKLKNYTLCTMCMKAWYQYIGFLTFLTRIDCRTTRFIQPKSGIHTSDPMICVFLGSCDKVRQWFSVLRVSMKLIQCYAWMPGYHTPSCLTDPFNLFLLSSLLWTCFTISGSSFPFLATPLRMWFKVNLVHLVVKSIFVLSYKDAFYFI